MLCRHEWPGNVRELMSVVRRAVVIGDGPLVGEADLIGLDGAPRSQPMPSSPSPPPARPRPGSEAEREVLLRTLADTQENITSTAQQLGVSRITLYRMLQRHAIV